MIKTVTTTSGVNTVTFPEFFKYFWIKNIGDTTVYASAFANVSAGVDNTSVIKSGDTVCVENIDNDNVYISGEGSVEIHAQNYAECPFKLGGKGGETPDLSAYAKKTDIPTELPANGGNADYATNAGNAEKLGGLDASAYSTSIIKSVTFSAATTDGYIWTGIPFPKYVIGVDLGHFDVIAQFFKGSNEATARAEWTMILVSKDDLTTPLNGSFNGIIYYID